MWNNSYVFVLMTVLLVCGYLVSLKMQHLRRKKGKKPIDAIVKKYKVVSTEISRMHWHSEWSIFVEVASGEKLIHQKMHHHILMYSKPFEIDEVVKVFWYAGQVYYWNAYEKGLFRFLRPFS